MTLPGLTGYHGLEGPERRSRTVRRRRGNSVDHPHFELPRLRDLAKRAAPQVVEATLIPLVLFYGALSLLGPKGAIFIALGWNYLALLRRLVRGERLPGLLLLATVGLTARSILALVSGNSMFVYFLQPSLATALVGGAFLLSVPLGRPLAEKLARDFVPLPPTFLKAAEGPAAVRAHQPPAGPGQPGQCGRDHCPARERAAHDLPGGQDGAVVGAHTGRHPGVVMVVPPGAPPPQCGNLRHL